MSKEDIRRRRKAIKMRHTIPEGNPKEIAALMDLLFEVTKCNNTHCARLLGISVPTWKRWTKNPPTAWYWAPVLREAIKHTLSSIIAQRRGTGKKYQRSVLEAMSKIPRHKEFEAEISDMAYDIRGAEVHLRELLAKKGMWWSDIRLAANCGGYTQATLRKAAKALRIQMRQEGFGADKDSFWRLPTEDEGDD